MGCLICSSSARAELRRHIHIIAEYDHAVRGQIRFYVDPIPLEGAVAFQYTSRGRQSIELKRHIYQRPRCLPRRVRRAMDWLAINVFMTLHELDHFNKGDVVCFHRNIIFLHLHEKRRDVPDFELAIARTIAITLGFPMESLHFSLIEEMTPVA